MFAQPMPHNFNLLCDRKYRLENKWEIGVETR